MRTERGRTSVVELEVSGVMCQRNRDARASTNDAGLPAALFEAYQRSVYRVAVAGRRLDIAVGETHADLDLLLSEAAVRSWALVTAANPGSHELSAEENAERQGRLDSYLRELGYRSFPGESFDPESGDFFEEQRWVLGIDREGAVALARTFGQAALLYGEIGGRAELVLVAPAARAADERDCGG